MGLLREPDLKRILKEAMDDMLVQIRVAVSDAVRANMPPMPQPNTHQIARLTVVVEGLKTEIANLFQGKDGSKAATTSEIRKIAEEAKQAMDDQVEAEAEVAKIIEPPQEQPQAEPEIAEPAQEPQPQATEPVAVKKKRKPKEKATEPVVS